MDGYLQDNLKDLAMLHLEIKIICLLGVLLMLSCKNEQQELQEKRRLFYDKSMSIIDADEYYRVYNKARDSVNYWIKNNLSSYVGLKLNTWQIDSLVCFNKDANKCIMTLLMQSTFFKKAIMDDITYLNGVKITNKWYFFSGGTLVLPREYYQKDIHTPLSFEKMKQLAMKEKYNNYLKKDANGAWNVNETFFSDLTSVAWCTDCKTQAQWDSAYLAQVRLNWKKRDYKEYDPNE